MKAASPLKKGVTMFEFGLGLGFALGLIAGLQLSRFIWPEYTESIWDRKKRENEIAQDAVERYKRRNDGDDQQEQ